MVTLPTQRQRATIAAYCILALLFALGPWSFFGWDYTALFFCPADTLVAGSIGPGPLWLTGSSFVAMLGLPLQILWFIPDPKRPRPPDILLAQRRQIGAIAGGCLLVIAIVMAVAGLSSSYCARPQGIFVHTTPFGEQRSYTWADVRKVTTYCSRGHRFGGIWFYFDTEMKDDQTIPLGTSEGQFVGNYHAVSDALRDVPFFYDNSGTSDCGSPLRHLLATRPGARVNEPN